MEYVIATQNAVDITKGKKYEFLRDQHNPGGGFLTDDAGSEIFISLKACFHLGGVDWEVVTEPANDNLPYASSINNLVNYFHTKSSNAGWWDEAGRDLRTDKYVHATKLMLVVTEISEAMEGLRKGLQDDKLPHRKMAEVELADALIRIFDLAGVLGYDLGGAVVEKDAYNSTRPDHKVENRAAAGGKAY